MPRTRSLAWSELKIGILSIVALTLAMIMIFLLGSAGGFFWQRYSVKVMFDNIAGLKSGAPVRIAGVEVGSVADVQFIGEKVDVTVEIGEEHQHRVTTGSRATLGTVSLLGEGAVDITPSSEGTPIPEWGYIPTGRPLPTLPDVANQATASIEEATMLLRDIRAGRGTVGQLFTDDRLYREINQLVASADRVASQIANGRGTLGRLTTDDTMYREATAAVKELNTITARIRNGEGSLGKLLSDPAFANSLTATTENIQGVTGRLNRGEGTAGKLLTETVLYDRLNSTIQQFESFTKTLNASEGTLGQLLKDKQLYENINSTVLELREFLAEVKKDPKKYLNVRVSIF
jgi:phospholipid/cholesterol/gamma-HCH transport system substrate-binding protein